MQLGPMSKERIWSNAKILKFIQLVDERPEELPNLVMEAILSHQYPDPTSTSKIPAFR
jgi:hypothetical protein